MIQNRIEIRNKLISALNSIGALAGCNHMGVENGIEGLGMSLEQSRCNELTKEVEEGLFKIVVMGSFATGKSTIINAMLGTEKLQASVLPTTAVLTSVQYGDDNEDSVDVYMADEIINDGSVRTGECIKMNIEDFRKEYQYTREDEIELMETGHVSRFEKVKYVAIHSSSPTLAGSVTILDTPGLEDRATAEDLLHLIQQAHVVIYTVSERGLCMNDRELIETVFRNCPSNVFFLINRFDLVHKACQSEMLEKAILELRSVFSDHDRFNEDLRKHRVFGVSALRALDARRGFTYDWETETEKPLDEGQKEKMLELSGFVPFEDELERFLTTDEKSIAQYMKCFRQMASTYRKAEKLITENTFILENEVQMDEERKAECAKIIADIENSIKLTGTSFDNCSLEIQDAVTKYLEGSLTHIEDSWEHDKMEIAKKIDVGTLTNIWTCIKQMNPFMSKSQKEENLEKAFKEIIDVETEHITSKLDTYLADNRKSLETVIADCQKRLTITLVSNDSLFDKLACELMNGKNTNAEKEDINLSLLIVPANLGELNASVIDGKLVESWRLHLKVYVFNSIWQSTLLMLAGLLGYFISFLQTRRENEIIMKLLENSKKGILNTLKNEVGRLTLSLRKMIAEEIGQKKDAFCATSTQKLLDEQARMRAIELSYENHSFNLEEEKKQYNNVLSAMYKQANEAYALVFGREMTIQQFKEIENG